MHRIYPCAGGVVYIHHRTNRPGDLVARCDVVLCELAIPREDPGVLGTRSISKPHLGMETEGTSS